MLTITINNRSLSILQGDITEQHVDAIVNAANSHLEHGGGVARAIAQKAGKQLIEESKKIDYVETGKAAITSAGNLPCKYVIHAVGPIWHGGNQNETMLLQSCVHESLTIAENHELSLIAFPAISTGIYGYPITQAAPLLLQSVKDFLQNQAQNVKKVSFVLFTNQDYRVFENAMNTLS